MNMSVTRFCNQSCFRVFLFLVISSFSALIAAGQEDTTSVKKKDSDKPKKYLTLFEKDDILDVTLEFDISKFMKKPDKAQTLEGKITIPVSATDTLDRKVTISYRGESRYERCSFPPMRVKFKKAIYEVSDSGKIKKMKIVNQCTRGPAYEDYLIRECLVYKMYNVLTDTSFRVRLIRINLVDIEGKRKPLTQYGIFLEPKELLASRINSVIINSFALSQRDIYPGMLDRMAIFNYMVSNWDWSIPGQHNVTILKSNQYNLPGLGIPVPFDFDLAGVVNSDYAIPPPEMGIKSNRERIFTGICRSRDVYRKELMMFLDKKDELYAVVNDYPYLSNGSKRDIISFLDQFYRRLENERSFDNLIDLFMKSCKKL